MQANKKALRIQLHLPDRESLSRLLRDYRLDIRGGELKRQPDRSVQMEAYVAEGLVDRFKEAGVPLEVIEDATWVGRERQKEVSKGELISGIVSIISVKRD
jgi:hypothetical protein